MALKKKATSLANKQDLRFPSVYQPKMKIIQPTKKAYRPKLTLVLAKTTYSREDFQRDPDVMKENDQESDAKEKKQGELSNTFKVVTHQDLAVMDH